MSIEAQKCTLFLGCKRISQNTLKANNNKPDNIEKIPKNASTFYRAFYLQNLASLRMLTSSPFVSSGNRFALLYVI